MRTLRLPLAGAVILVLLGGLSVAAVARVDVEAGPSLAREVSGTIDLGAEIRPPTVAITEHLVQKRGSEWATNFRLNDPRWPDSMVSVWNHDEFRRDGPSDGPRIIWGTLELRDTEGAWAGSFDGVQFEANGDVDLQAKLEGTGAYEGLCAILSIEHTDGDDFWEVKGLIFEGELPPMLSTTE